MPTMTRGQLAARGGVNPETLRYYERRGLLTTPRRTASNHRRYVEADLQRLRFIKNAQDLGFSLGEVEELLDLRSSRTKRCADVTRRVEIKILDIDSKIQKLQEMRTLLARLVDECPRTRPIAECNILKHFDAEKSQGG